MLDPSFKQEIAELVQGLVELLAITVPASVARTLIGRGTFWSLLRITFLGTFVGYFVAGVLHDLGMSGGLAGAIIAVSALISDDILLIIVKLSNGFKSNPESMVRKVARSATPGWVKTLFEEDKNE